MSSRALTLYPFWMSSRRHSTCPPSAAEWTGSRPERRIAFLVVMEMRVLRALQGDGGGGQRGGAGPNRKRARSRDSEKQMLKEENSTTGHRENCSLDCGLSYSRI